MNSIILIKLEEKPKLLGRKTEGSKIISGETSGKRVGIYFLRIVH